MKILIISDIHANLPALEMLLPYIKQVDKTICLGDVLGYHCFVNEVIDFIRSNNIESIKGNHDQYVIEGLDVQTKVINDAVRFGIKYAQKVITADNFEWLNSLPTQIGYKFDNCSLLGFHGSPWNTTNEYIYADSLKFESMKSFSADFIFLGHTHRSFLKTLDNGLKIINPGSVGQSRDKEGLVCAVILDTVRETITEVSVEYDYMQTINHAIDKGAKEWIYKHFKTLI